MAENSIRFGIIGCAEIARKVARAITLAPNTTLSAIGSRSIDKARRFAAQNGFPDSVKIYGSYDAFLDDPSVDAVFAPLLTSLHVRWAVSAAERKKHVLLEKPTALNVADLDLILDACRSSGVQFMDGTMWMQHPRTQMMKEALSDTTRFGQLRSEPEALVSLIKKCRSLRELKPIQAHMVRTGLDHDPFLTSKLIESTAITLTGHVSHAQLIFSRAHQPNTFMWNTMIRGHSLTDAPLNSLSLYQRMHSSGAQINSYTLAFVLKACCRLLRLEEGRQIHGQITKMGHDSEVPMINGLIRLYVSCGRVDSARQVFDVMAERDSNSWSVMIAGYAQNGGPHEALALFREMQISDVDIDGFTLASVVGVCGELGALDLGKWAHSYIDRKGLEIDVVLGNALVDMYAKCGLLDKAHRVFQRMDEKDVFVWSTMIGGYAIHGYGEKALQVFADMISANVRPTCVTFTSVLCACSHSGLIDEGRRCFDSMWSEYRIEPQIEHYGCMVDLFCRAGCINEAHDFISSMPIEPNAVLWRTLLSACKVHGHTKLGAYISRKLLELDPKSGENYVLVSNIYASLGRWSSVSKIRTLMKNRKVKRRHAWSSIEVNFTVHEFVMGDDSHPESDEIYKMVDRMARRLREAGHVAATTDVLHDIDEEEKEHALGLHSERLAIAYGLLRTCKGSPIRVVKNLRVCSDCHSVTKIISSIYEREIIIRDRVRFHHFKDGKCSCADYW